MSAVRRYRFTALVTLDPASRRGVAGDDVGGRLACYLIELCHRMHFPAGIALDETMLPAVRAVVSIALVDGEDVACFAPASGSRSGPTPPLVTRYGPTAGSGSASSPTGYPRLCQILNMPGPRGSLAGPVDTAWRRRARRTVAAECDPRRRIRSRRPDREGHVLGPGQAQAARGVAPQ